jgi:hypothetical protein
MRRDKIIAIVGVSEEATAHLRLLIRQAGPQLSDRWRWGTEVEADLIVVDPSVFAGQMAQTRAQAAGVPCAVLADAPPTNADCAYLHKPLKLANVVKVLNEAALPSVATGSVTHQSDDFYFEHDAAERGAAEHLSPRAGDGPVALGLDEMIKGDPLAEPEPVKKPLLPADVTIDNARSGSRRSETRANDNPDAWRRSDAEPEPLTPRATGRQPGLDPPPSAAPRGLGMRAPLPEEPAVGISAFLDGDVLKSPSRIKLDGAPALVLDPKNRVFHAEGTIDKLEPYCRQPIDAEAWRTVTSGELNELRSRQAARPYEELKWLDALLKSQGRLAAKLDPGGAYRLKQRVDVSPMYRVHGPIADAMREHARLHEIAANSGAAMETVFDIVNAYDAIGWLEWIPRQRLRAQDEKPKGLLGKLKWPFGKG